MALQEIGQIFQNDLIVESIYMLSGVLFILSLGGLSSPISSKRGNIFGMYGMALAIGATLFTSSLTGAAIAKFFISLAAGGLIGIILALRVEMIAMPQLVACLHSFVGIAATVVGYGSYFSGQNLEDTAHDLEMYIGIFIGVVTFIGSVIAWGKLSEKIGSAPLVLCGSFRHILNLITVIIIIILGGLFISTHSLLYINIMVIFALFLGWHLIMAIGGADMPVVVSMLNSYSGWATAASGFMLENNLLIISGALVGSSGAILSYIMCKGMNRAFWSVIMGGFGLEPTTEAVIAEGATMKEALSNEVFEELRKARSVVIVPGYGMAVSRCQEEVGNLCKVLRKLGKDAKFCIHPVAGRLPGHMDVLLAEAKVPYTYVFEMEKVNHEFPKTDVVLVVGANDIVNPDALENPNSVIVGMPVCEVWHSKRVFVIKRGKSTGYAKIENPLFYKENTRMYFGDAKARINDLLTEFAKETGETLVQKKEDSVAVDVLAQVEEDMSEIVKNCTKEIAVPREVKKLEKRVAITPAIAKKFAKIGFRVKIETKAGEAAGFSDEAYKKAGAIITDTKDIWDNSEIIVKVRAPEFNSSLGDDETEHMQKTKLLISYVYPGQNPELMEKLMKNKPGLTVFALDCTPRITRAQKLDTLSSTANLTGYRAVIEAFHEFGRFSKQVSSAAGKVPPSKMLIMGAGVAGLAAVGLAKSMGSIVRCFDVRAAAKEQVESLGGEFLEVDYKEDGDGGGGYAKEMSEGYKQAQAKMINAQCKEVDIVITTALIPGKRAPILLTKEQVRMMKPNSIIVDLAAEMQGNCELTKPGERFVDPESRVIILGYTDLASRMANQSSELFATNMYNLFEEICNIPRNPKNNAANFTIDFEDEIIKGLTIIREGEKKWPPQQSSAPQPAQNSQPNQSKDVKEVAKVPEQKPDQVHGHEKNALPDSDEQSPLIETAVSASVLIVFFIMLGIGLTDAPILLNRIFIFILAIIIGYMVIWNVTPALHTPLMSVTNAISGIIIVGCMLELNTIELFAPESIFGLIGVFFASINVFGGFIVTYKMLNMFTNH